MGCLWVVSTVGGLNIGDGRCNWTPCECKSLPANSYYLICASLCSHVHSALLGSQTNANKSAKYCRVNIKLKNKFQTTWTDTLDGVWQKHFAYSPLELYMPYHRTQSGYTNNKNKCIKLACVVRSRLVSTIWKWINCVQIGRGDRVKQTKLALYAENRVLRRGLVGAHIRSEWMALGRMAHKARPDH